MESPSRPTMHLARLIQMAFVAVAMLVVLVHSNPIVRSSLDRCMYDCYEDFSDCYNTTFTTSGDANACVRSYNFCFRDCYNRDISW